MHIYSGEVLCGSIDGYVFTTYIFQNSSSVGDLAISVKFRGFSQYYHINPFATCMPSVVKLVVMRSVWVFDSVVLTWVYRKY